MTFAQAHDDALAALDQNSASYALDQLRAALDYPGLLARESEWKAALVLLERMFTQLGNATLANRARAVAEDLDSVDGLHGFGGALIAQHLPALGATMLQRAQRMAPSREDVLAQLAAALEMTGRFEDARKILAAASPRTFLPRYLLAFETLMTGDAPEARRLAAALTPVTPVDGYMCNRLKSIFARMDAIRSVTSFDPNDRRGWHFALTGGLLLHLPSAQNAPTRRYDYLEDSEALCLEGVRRFGAVMKLWRMKIPRLLAFENPESRRLGLAMGEILDVRVEHVHLPEQPGLFVAYDLESIIPEVVVSLRPARENLMVYSHASQWTIEHQVAPDFTTVQYASIVPPWNRHAIFPWRPDLPKGPPTESDAELAHRISRAPLAEEAPDDLPHLLAIAEAGKEFASARRTTGGRERQWIGA